MPAITKADRIAAVAAWQANPCERTRNRILELNRGIIGVVIRKYFKYGVEAGLYDDMFQEGILGMCRALNSFDPSKSSFSTYSGFWIRSFVGRWLERNQAEDRCQLHKYRNSPTRRLELVDDFEDNGGAEDGVIPGQVVVSNPDPTPEMQVNESRLAIRVLNAIAGVKLTTREQLILEMRLLSTEPASLKDLGEILNLSREGARLIEGKLIRKLKPYLQPLALEVL